MHIGNISDYNLHLIFLYLDLLGLLSCCIFVYTF